MAARLLLALLRPLLGTLLRGLASLLLRTRTPIGLIVLGVLSLLALLILLVLLVLLRLLEQTVEVLEDFLLDLARSFARVAFGQFLNRQPGVAVEPLHDVGLAVFLAARQLDVVARIEFGVLVEFRLALWLHRLFRLHFRLLGRNLGLVGLVLLLFLEARSEEH